MAVLPPAPRRPRTVSTAGPVPSLDVVVPDYQVRSSDGVNRVEIPGGYVWLEKGEPETPYYSVALQYPQGCRIQDVGLTGRSGLTAATGLNLPIATMDFAGLAANSQSQPSTAMRAGFPRRSTPGMSCRIRRVRRF